MKIQSGHICKTINVFVCISDRHKLLHLIHQKNFYISIFFSSTKKKIPLIEMNLDYNQNDRGSSYIIAWAGESNIHAKF